MRFVKRARTALAILALSASACGSSGALANTEQYRPPPPLALVVLVDPSSGSMADQLRQLEDVIRASASPNESVVVMMLQTGSARQYVVRPGDSLSSIAAANGLTLSTVEAVNPQFGPVSGRNWSVIHSGQRVTLPDGAARAPLLLATRAPATLAPRSLVDVTLVIANVSDPQAVAAWKSAGVAAGAPSVNALDPALTQLQLAQIVNQ